VRLSWLCDIRVWRLQSVQFTCWRQEVLTSFFWVTCNQTPSRDLAGCVKCLEPTITSAQSKSWTLDNDCKIWASQSAEPQSATAVEKRCTKKRPRSWWCVLTLFHTLPLLFWQQQPWRPQKTNSFYVSDDFLFVTVYHEIRDHPEMMKGILSARSQSALFLQIMDRATGHSSVSMCGLNNYLCTNRHELTKFVVQRFFNCVAKMLAKEMTSQANPLTEQAAHRGKSINCVAGQNDRESS